MARDATHKERILVVEDEAWWRSEVEGLLKAAGYIPKSANTAKDGIRLLRETFFDIAILDWYTPEMNGDEFLRIARTCSPATFVIVYSAMEDADRLAAEHGADDFVFKNARSLAGLRCALTRALKRKTDKVRAVVDSSAAGQWCMPIGDSAPMRKVRSLIEEAAQCELPVLIEGDTGTGKELVARAIHSQGPRVQGKLLVKNCATLSGDLLNSDLFGHVRGAFTGAVDTRPGLFELASTGTLFLDEVAELGKQAQTRLLRAVEEGVVQRVGSHDDIVVDTRIITATNRRLTEEVEQKRFRLDLLYRLNALPIRLPRLVERTEDIHALVEHFLRLYGGEKAVERALTPDALKALQRHDFPGNVRELANIIQRGLIKARGDILSLDHLHLDGTGSLSRGATAFGSLHKTYPEALVEFEMRFFTELVVACDGNIAAAARAAKISRTHLHRKLKDLAIKVERP